MLAEAWWRGDRSENAAVESTQPVKEIELWRNPNKPSVIELSTRKYTSRLE